MTRRAAVTLSLPLGEAELNALLLGLSRVAGDESEELAEAAERVLRQINDALPPPTGRTSAKRGEASLRALIRRAIDAEEILHLRYTDKAGRASERTVWPIAFDHLGSEELVAAWCEKRADFRHFRLDRINAATSSGRGYPRRRRLLLAAWRLRREEDGIGWSSQINGWHRRTSPATACRDRRPPGSAD